MPHFDTPDWDARHPAVHREDLFNDVRQRALALLRHPSVPFRARIADDAATLFEELCQVAEAYLERIAPLDADLSAALKLAKGRAEIGFGWVPLGWDGPQGDIDPFGSFAVRRVHGGQAIDGTLVLLAGNRRRLDRGQKTARVEAQGVGLRIVMHMDRPLGTPGLLLRVCGLSASLLNGARTPKGKKMHPGAGAVAPAPTQQAAEPPPRDLVDDLLTPEKRDALQSLIAQIFGFSRKAPVALNGLEPLSNTLVRVAGVGAREDAAGGLSGYQWLLDFDFARLSSGGKPELVEIRQQLVEQLSEGAAGAARAGHRIVPARLFLQDAASAGSPQHGLFVKRRVTRDEALLDRFRAPGPIPAELRSERFEVRQSVVADRRNDPNAVQCIDPQTLPLRGDHLAAAHAYCRAEELFAVLERAGLRCEAVFRFARLPLLMRHRAWFRGKPDGKSVNAQVRLQGSPLASLPKPELKERPQLEVCFGAAALRHREIQLTDHGRHTAQPLGLAADPRWAWHEFGHVLAYAATGALEFHFAHSVGDALAAVLNDPESGLGGADGRHPLRGETFPWVSTGRRHDREAQRGWCWCGQRNGMRHAAPRPLPLLFKGYLEEQMLSSSIFRLYRALGGDTLDDTATRKRAARLCAHLVIRALMLCGPAMVVPVRSADAWVSAMIDADIGSRARDADDPQGGCLHKVVRWAFEQQGLFATDDPGIDLDGAGQPPAVDLWIEDRRPSADGGYQPVPLRWGASEPWHASPRALRLGGGALEVALQNRGAKDAKAIQVRAWAAPDRGDKRPLVWRPLGHARITRIAGRGRAQLRIALPQDLPRQPLFVLTDASCAADHSNLDPATALPCSSATPPTRAAQLIDLVAHDNNLALSRFSALP